MLCCVVVCVCVCVCVCVYVCVVCRWVLCDVLCVLNISRTRELADCVAGVDARRALEHLDDGLGALHLQHLKQQQQRLVSQRVCFMCALVLDLSEREISSIVGPIK